MAARDVPDGAWADRTVLSLLAATVVLVLVEATLAGVLAGLLLGLVGPGLILVGLGATLLGFVGWGVAGLAAALVAAAALRSGEIPGRADLAAAGAGLLVVGVAATIANPAGGMIVGADLFDPRPLTPFQAGVGALALATGTLGTALLARTLGGDRLGVLGFALVHLIAGGLAVVDLPVGHDVGPVVGAAGAVVAQAVLLGALVPLLPEPGPPAVRAPPSPAEE